MGLTGSTAHAPAPIKVAMSPDQPVLMRIEQRGDKWVVLPEKGDRVLGTHDSKEDAVKQLAAIEASKARAAKHQMQRHIGKSMRFSASLNEDGQVRTGVWDRGETFGKKPKDGVDTIFSVETFNQFIDNWLGRGEPLSVCYNHQTAYVAQNGAPAPALAFHDAAAIVKDGEVVRFAKLGKSHAMPPSTADLGSAVRTLSTDEDPEPSSNGLWWYRCEVTPLGQELLPNYKFLSPMFVPDGTDEYGNEIGYTIYDHAATNTAFQAGCMIQFEAGQPRLAPLLDCEVCGQKLADVDFDGRLPNHVGRDNLPCSGSEKEPSQNSQGAMSTAKKGGSLMARQFEEGTRKRIGFEEGSDDAAIMQAFSKTCMEAVKKFEEDSKKLLEEEDEKDATKMESHKMARMESIKKFEENAKCLEADAESLKMAMPEEGEGEEKPHVIMKKLARAMSRFAKMARMEIEPFKGKETPAEEKAEKKEEAKVVKEEVKPEVKMEKEEDEEEAKKQLAQRFEIDPKVVTFGRVLNHINMKLTGAEQVALLQQKINLLEQKDAERAVADKTLRAQTFSRWAISESRITEDKKDSIEKIFIRDGEEEAKKFIFEKDTFNALKVHTSGGNPPDHNPEPTKFVTMERKGTDFDRAVRMEMSESKVDYSTAMESVFKKNPSLYER